MWVRARKTVRSQMSKGRAEAARRTVDSVVSGGRRSFRERFADFQDLLMQVVVLLLSRRQVPLIRNLQDKTEKKGEAGDRECALTRSCQHQATRFRGVITGEFKKPANEIAVGALQSNSVRIIVGTEVAPYLTYCFWPGAQRLAVFRSVAFHEIVPLK